MRLSVQLYTLRDQLSYDVPGTLRQVRGIGLEWVEFAGGYGKSASEWRTMLDGEGLKVSGSHIGISAIENEFDQVVEDCKILDNEFVVVPWVAEKDYEGGWDAFGHRLEAAAAKLKDQGLQLAYHNHAFEFTRGSNGRLGLETLYDSTAPDLVKSELDVAWVQIGGGDPAAWIERLKGRIPLIHLKDYNPDMTPQWQPGGDGVVDWNAVLAAAKNVGVEFGAIELDESPGDPVEAVRSSYRFFSGRGLR